MSGKTEALLPIKGEKKPEKKKKEKVYPVSSYVSVKTHLTFAHRH